MSEFKKLFNAAINYDQYNDVCLTNTGAGVCFSTLLHNANEELDTNQTDCYITTLVPAVYMEAATACVYEQHADNIAAFVRDLVRAVLVIDMDENNPLDDST